MMNMDADNFMHAIMKSFQDADLRVELLPGSQVKPGVTRVDTGSGPARERNDATAQAIDGRYASVYKVHHCKVIPTSPPEVATEFPPQHPEVSPGGDNFQVGGTGSGETGYAPSKTTCYRGGMTWASRGSVYTPRPSPYCDPFVSSLRKYPSLSPERTAEVLTRLANCGYNTGIPGNRYSPRHSPTRHESSNTCCRNYKVYEQSCVNCRPRAPEECPTRDKRDETFRKQTSKQGDMKFIRDVSRKLRESLKSISSYTHTHTATFCSDARDREWYDSAIPETSETECDPHENVSAHKSYPVNTTVQAVASTVSRGVETAPLPTLNKRTVAVPPSPRPSSSILSALPDLVTTRSVQTFFTPGRSVETTTSSVELAKHDLFQPITRKSKSMSDFKLNWDFKNEILSWLDDTSDPKIKEIQEIVLKNLAYRLNGKPIPEGDRVKVKIGNCLKSRIKAEPKDRSVNESNKRHGHRILNLDVFRAEIQSRIAVEHRDFEDVIKEWLNNISIKKRDILLRPVKKDQIYNTFVNRLKPLVIKQSEHCREQSLRDEIMEILDEVPIEINTCDKTVYLERLTDTLMCRLESITRDHTDSEPCKLHLPDKFHLNSNAFQPTAKETREFVDKKMVDLLKIQNGVNPELVKEIILDIVDILMNSVNTNVGLEQIASLLHNATKLSENEAFKYATQLTEHWRITLNEKYKNIDRIHPFTVLMVHQIPANPKTSVTNVSQHSIGSIVEKDIEANLHQYKLQLAAQIERWLSGLEILQEHDKDFRHAVILDLANDIVDRQKYLEFNKIRGTDMDELEHLKYQIFKWVKRLIGEDRIETIDHAAELMEMIKNIPVPMLNNSQDTLCRSNSAINRNKDILPGTSNPNSGAYTHNQEEPTKHQNDSTFTNFVIHNISTTKKNDARKSKPRMQTPSPPSRPSRSDTSVHNNSDSRKNSPKTRKKSIERKQKKNNEVNQNVMEQSYETNRLGQINQDAGPSGLVTPIPPCSNRPSSQVAKLMADWRPPPVFTPPPPGKPLMGQIHDEFQDYLEHWVQQIPISANTPEEVKIAEKARLGILHGIWKKITKLKTQPTVFQNNFYYEDVLGKEIDELLDCLPQTQELKEKRYMLKSQLLERTSDMNDLIKEIQTPENYKKTVEQKQQEKEDETVRKSVKVDHENPTKMFEQLLKYCILDDFLFETNYKETDKIKASAYRINLLKSIQAYLDELKATYRKEIEDNFSAVNLNDIFKILRNVPLPTDNDISADADEILLGLEIEQWMSNLPIIKNDDANEQRQRLRLRDALAKKLYQMEKGTNIPPCCGETEVKHEISFFLEKIPLERDQDLKINEMVEELTNRLKTRRGVRRKSVAFEDKDRNQQRTNQSGRLQNRNQLSNATLSGADRLNMTGDEWALEDEDAQYRAFHRNDPLCSTRLNLLREELAIADGQGSQYRAVFKDGPACSTMIEPESGYGLENHLPDFRRQDEQEPYYAYAPGQFHESGRGGAFGYPMHKPQSDGRYPEFNETPIVPRYGSHSQRFFDNEANVDVPLSDQYRPVMEPQNLHINKYMSMADARHLAPPVQANRHTAFDQPPDFDWEGGAGFMTMEDHHPPMQTRASSPHRSQANPNLPVHDVASPAGHALSSQEFVSMESNPPPAMYISGRSNRSRIDPNMSQDASPDIFSSGKYERSEQGPPEAFIPDASRFSRATNRNEMESDVLREHEISRHEGVRPQNTKSQPDAFMPDASRFLRAMNISRRKRNEMESDVLREPHKISVREGMRPQNPMSQPDAAEQGAFVSMASHRPAEVLPSAAASETSTRNQLLRQSKRSERFRGENNPEPFAEPQGAPEFHGRDGTHETNQNRHSQGARNRSTDDTSTRQNSPTDKINPEAALRAPAATMQGSDRGLLASTIPSIAISDQPPFFSTPNQRSGNPPPQNIRERRQMEQDRARRQINIDTNEGDGRCHCMERFFKRWNRRSGASQCTTCDDCVDGGSPGFYPYPYPYMYPYPPFIRPPYPPYCRR